MAGAPTAQARRTRGYNHLLRTYLLPAFGPLPLKEVSATVVRSWWRGLDSEKPTVNARAYALLRAIFSNAVEDEES